MERQAPARRPSSVYLLKWVAGNKILWQLFSFCNGIVLIQFISNWHTVLLHGVTFTTTLAPKDGIRRQPTQQSTIKF